MITPQDLTDTPTRPRRSYVDLFLISFLILFFELACIRWFGSMVVHLTFFTNIVLLATFLGMSIGCLSASKAKDWAGRLKTSDRHSQKRRQQDDIGKKC